MKLFRHGDLLIREVKELPEHLKLLKYECPSTGRVYVKFVPFEMKKADESQAWSFSLTVEQYNKLKIEA